MWTMAPVNMKAPLASVSESSRKTRDWTSGATPLGAGAAEATR